MSDIITNTTSTNESKVFNVYVSKSTTAGTALVTRGSLNKTDTAPTVAGLYILEETGIYPNLGNIDAEAGKLNFASFDGTTWSLIATSIPQFSQNIRIYEDLPNGTILNAKEQVISNNVTYIVKYGETAVVGTDMPGDSNKWEIIEKDNFKTLNIIYGGFESKNIEDFNFLNECFGGITSNEYFERCLKIQSSPISYSGGRFSIKIPKENLMQGVTYDGSIDIYIEITISHAKGMRVYPLVRAHDINSNTKVLYDKSFYPKNDISVLKTGKIKIIASDINDLDFITIQFEDFNNELSKTIFIGEFYVGFTDKNIVHKSIKLGKKSNNGLPPHEHNWILSGYDDSRNKKIKSSSYDFNSNPIFDLDKLVFSESISSNGISLTHQIGKLNFNGVGECLLKSAIKNSGLSQYHEIEVSEIGNSTIGLGIAQNDNNYLIGKIDFENQTVFIEKNEGGVKTTENGVFLMIDVPFKLCFHINGVIATLLIEKDGVLHYLGAMYYDLLRYRNTYTSYNTSIYVKNLSNKVSLSKIEVGHTSGLSFGSDFGLVQYENGEPFISDNYYYFTASVHSTLAIGGASGLSIYRFKKNTIECEFVGHIDLINGNNILCSAAGKIIYNRYDDHWYIQATDFYTEKGLWMGKTKNSPLQGVLEIPVQKMNIPLLPDNQAWDMTMIWNEDNKRWEITYTRDPEAEIVRCVASKNSISPITTYTYELSANVAAEGCTVVFMNNQKYIICTTYQQGLDVLNYDTLQKIGTIMPNKWINGSAPNSWGFILANENGDSTEFIMFVFSSIKFNGFIFGYGDLAIYKSDLKENGVQFRFKDIH